MNDARALSRRDHLVGAALCIGYLLLLVGTASDLAMSRDESFYVHAAKNAANWISQIFVDPSSAFAQRKHRPSVAVQLGAPGLDEAELRPDLVGTEAPGAVSERVVGVPLSRHAHRSASALADLRLGRFGHAPRGGALRKPGVCLDAEGFLPQPSRLLRHSDRILRHAHRVHVLAVPGRSTLGSLARPVIRLGARYQAQQLDPARDLPDSFSLDSS